MDINDKKRERFALLESAKAIVNNDEKVSEFREMMSQADQLGKIIAREERRMDLEAGIKNPLKDHISAICGGSSGADGDFRNLADFIGCVRFPELRQMRAMSMGTGGSGGFLVPSQYMPEIFSLAPEASIVRPRARILPAGDPPDAEISGPALSQGTAGAFGGVTVSWIGEGDTKPETTPALLEVTLEPKEIAAHIIVTDKLLRNSAVAGPWIGALLKAAISDQEDYEFLCGTGAGRPLGVKDADGTIGVARNTSMTFKLADVANMLSKLLPGSFSRAVWVINQSVMGQLISMVDAGNHSVFIGGDVSKGMPPTLFGIPIIFSGRTPVLGTRGDVMLLDLSYYLIKDGSGPFVDASPHVYFTSNKTIIKVFWNTDGQPWVTAPLTLKDGSTTVSPYVVLV